MYSSRPRQAHPPARTAHPRPSRSAHQTGFLQPTRVPGACLAAAAITCPRPCAPCTKVPPTLPHLQAFSSMNSLSRLQIKAEQREVKRASTLYTITARLGDVEKSSQECSGELPSRKRKVHRS
ncbi:hypothetical protein E2C01_011205 [Portunus trituberculatus]|uniref:Uncharacterized protein n=1 Tax=Portunus trituberculatus TaxID=210409 RepID=A0A5B7DAP9_PORTR|nr:hypothetical protein [Portunus trituberculatus]